ncbi:extracellular solute-binding protein [Martelella soudanensis]|uniref:extracellular solute-binding protein n=1 Tax=unclassified Martelella TaxID=2629616 RepID=UPI0015DF29C8|nr:MULTISPECIES: extracellular solute-binding protein [unclassified Martelella]
MFNKLSVLTAMTAVVLLPFAAHAEQVVVAHAAGINGNAVEAILKDYSAATGVDAVGITMSDTDYGAKMQLAARTGRSDFDLALGVTSDIYNLIQPQGVFTAIDTSGWNADVLDAMKEAGLIGEDYAVSQDTAALLVYSPTFEDDAPASWSDFFDTAKWPGNRGMASGGMGVPINLEYALIASGVQPDELYPLDLEKAFAELDRVADSIVLWDNAPKGIQDLVNGDTVMTWSYAPAALSAVKAGQDIKLAAPPGTAVARQYAVVMEGAPNGNEAAQQFLKWWFEPEQQVKYTELTNYGIVVPSPLITGNFTEEQQAYMPFSGNHPENYRTINYDYYSSEGDLGQSNLSLVLDGWNNFRAR